MKIRVYARSVFGFILFIFIFIASFTFVYAEDGSKGDDLIHSVDVNLLVSPGDLYQPLQNRIKSAVEEALEKAFVGKSKEQLLEMEESLESSSRAVIDKLLTGFELRDLKVDIEGNKVEFYIFIIPSSPIIHTVNVDISIDTGNKELSALVENMGEELEKSLTDLLTGIPIDTFKWAEPFLKPALGLLLLNQFPGFDYDYDIAIDRISSMKIRLIPTGERVERVKTSIISDSIPRLLLRGIAEDFNEKVGILENLPVAFVEKQRERLEKLIDNAIMRGIKDSAYAVASETEISAGEDTSVNIILSLNNYRIKAAGDINMGLQGISPKLTFYSSRIFNNYGGLEIFARIGAGLKREDLSASTGFGYPIFDLLYLELEHGFYPARNNISLTFSPTRNFDLKVTQSLPSKEKTVDLAYSLTDYYSVYLRYNAIKGLSAGVGVDF